MRAAGLAVQRCRQIIEQQAGNQVVSTWTYGRVGCECFHVTTDCFAQVTQMTNR